MARLDAALRDERQARRDREQQAADAAAGSEARRAELETALAEARQRVAAAEQVRRPPPDGGPPRRSSGPPPLSSGPPTPSAGLRSRRAPGGRVGQRAVAAATEAAYAEERRRRAEAAALAGELPPGARSADDSAALQQIARAAEELAAGLRRLADGPSRSRRRLAFPACACRPASAVASASRPGRAGRRADSRQGPRRTTPPRRAPVRIPPGMLQDDPAAIEAMIRTPGLAVIVDGYNVSMLAWPDASAADQRDRLCDALAEFQLRFRCEVTVVFDGADVPGVRPLRRRGLRVVFSAAGQEADEVVVGEVMFRPAEVPVIVVSSDREVRAGAEMEGATVLASDELLQLMRR